MNNGYVQTRWLRFGIGGLWKSLDRWQLAFIGAKLSDSLTTIIALSVLGGFEESNTIARSVYGVFGQVPGSALIAAASCVGVIVAIEGLHWLNRSLEGDAGVTGYADVIRSMAYGLAALSFGLFAVRNAWVILQ